MPPKPAKKAANPKKAATPRSSPAPRRVSSATGPAKEAKKQTLAAQTSSTAQIRQVLLATAAKSINKSSRPR